MQLVAGICSPMSRRQRPKTKATTVRDRIALGYRGSSRCLASTRRPRSSINRKKSCDEPLKDHMTDRNSPHQSE
jgi:hypothetical protein